jgi:Ca2+-binding RTX toxin-like protein
MLSLLKKLRGSNGGRSRGGARRSGAPRVRPALEGLEARELKTGSITFNIDTVTIDGLATSTQAKVEFDGRDWWNPFDDLVRVTQTDRLTGQLVDQAAFPAGVVHRVVFNGGDGNDAFVNSTGITSTAYGDAGNDNLQGGGGVDALFGGDGYDFLYGQGGNDSLYGGNQDDVLDGGSGNDTLSGDWGNDQLKGGNDNDYLYGGYGNDRLLGNGGTDVLFGEAGNDYLDGGHDNANDFVHGGTGGDQFVQNWNYVWPFGFFAEDTIADKNDWEGDRIL